MKRPTPDELTDSPELAALAIAAAAAEIARRALFAEHPDLLCGDFLVEQAAVTPRQCLAAAVISALDALSDTVEHYAAHVDALASQCASSDGHSNDIPI